MNEDRTRSAQTLELAGQRVLVLGLGISGLSAARFCADAGARVVAADERPATALAGLDGIAGDVALRVGEALPDAAEFDLVVPSPGVPRERYAGRARRAWGDIELAGRALAVPIVAVTGTNGKSTTVCLIEALLRASGLRATAAGNLGRPALSLVGEALDVAVLEVSSFQLEATQSFRPRVAVVLNVTPDHLDRHGDFAGYVAAKQRILANQRAEDSAVLDFDDSVVRGLAQTAKARILPFARSTPHDPGAWLDAGSIRLQDDALALRIPLDDASPAARDNLDNVLAALAAAHAVGADLERAASALSEFQGLPHRCETVATRAGVRFVNDSKATNPGAAQRSLERFEAPLIWIAGGRGKGLDPAPLAAAARGRVRSALLIGEAADELAAALGASVPHERCSSLDEAVERAAALAQRGEVVLLSPACASFDQFTSFEQRGEHFRAAVAALAPEAH